MQWSNWKGGAARCLGTQTASEKSRCAESAGRSVFPDQPSSAPTCPRPSQQGESNEVKTKQGTSRLRRWGSRRKHHETLHTDGTPPVSLVWSRCAPAFTQILFWGKSGVVGRDGTVNDWELPRKCGWYLKGNCIPARVETLTGKFEFLQHTELDRHLCRILDQTGLGLCSTLDGHCDLWTSCLLAK